MSSPELPSPPASAARRFAHEGLLVWRLGLTHLLERWWQLLLIVGIGAVLVLTIGGNGSWDDRCLTQIRQPENATLNRLAEWLSYWGDAIWAVLLAIVLFVIGVTCGSPRWRQIAWACLLAGVASTIVVNIFRPTLGRARPYTNLPGEFHGPTLKAAYHGFPSGHATSAFASAAAVSAAMPVVGVPCLIFAGSVSWSRMQLNKHHPVDVMTGAALGTLIGLCFGSGVTQARYRMSRKARQ